MAVADFQLHHPLWTWEEYHREGTPATKYMKPSIVGGLAFEHHLISRKTLRSAVDLAAIIPAITSEILTYEASQQVDGDSDQ